MKSDYAAICECGWGIQWKEKQVRALAEVHAKSKGHTVHIYRWGYVESVDPDGSLLSLAKKDSKPK